LLALLPGCADRVEPHRVVVQRERVVQKVPARLLVCDAPPQLSDCKTQSCVALILADLKASGDDCRAKLDAVRGLVEAE
jgi:hypothetical protein